MQPLNFIIMMLLHIVNVYQWRLTSSRMTLLTFLESYEKELGTYTRKQIVLAAMGRAN